MDISPAIIHGRTLRSAIAAVVAAATAFALAPAFFAPVEAAHHRTHTTSKAARFVSDLGRVQAALNQCRGPVAWNSHGQGAPWLLFEHNYCGGSWSLSTRAGDLLQVRNGPLAGTWRANGRVRVVHRGALVSTTRGLGRLVVQTCIPGTSRMRLVGFDRAR